MKFAALLFFAVLCGCTTKVKYPPGGYDYPVRVADRDTNYYFLPVRKLVPRHDSFIYADTYPLYRSFDEPNLSIRSLGQDRFRLCYQGGLVYPVFITLTSDEIIVKTVKSGDPYPEENEEQLSEVERLHYDILKNRFPLEEWDRPTLFGKNLDSLIRLYPELLSPGYYECLVDKVKDRNQKRFMYNERKVKIFHFEFTHFVDMINASGYWSLPYSIGCAEPPQDGGGFTLEANTGKKYNVVSRGDCAHTASDLVKVCQELVNYAGVGDRVHFMQ